MPPVAETPLRAWASGPRQTEADKCANAERAVRKAIDAWPSFRQRTVRVFAQGSYANRTNVRADSDVDITVCLESDESYFYDLSFVPGMTREALGIGAPLFSYADFKNEVERALLAYFGQPAIRRGKKAFDIHPNTYRLDADAVACLVHRRYLRRPDGQLYYESGVQFNPDNGGSVINWPRQAYDNGVAKNQATGERYKAMVRLLKNLRNEMQAAHVAAASDVVSFLLESLVYNMPNDAFGHTAYSDDVRQILTVAWNATRTDQACERWVEVSERKWLFRPTQPWTREQVNLFLAAAWNHLGFT